MLRGLTPGDEVARTTPQAVAARLLGAFPPLDELDRGLALALYRELAGGAPVAPHKLAPRAAIAPQEAARRVQAWPGVYYDDEKRVIGFWGLGLAPMRHRMRVAGRELFAWCAWDTLFLPGLLDARAEIVSACRGTGTGVRLSVSPQGIESAAPDGLRVSFFLPSAQAVRADVISSFCHYVHFFCSPETAAAWLKENPRAFLLSLAQAHEVGRIVNRARYGDLTE